MGLSCFFPFNLKQVGCKMYRIPLATVGKLCLIKNHELKRYIFEIVLSLSFNHLSLVQEKLLRVGHIFEQTLQNHRFVPPLLA